MRRLPGVEDVAVWLRLCDCMNSHASPVPLDRRASSLYREAPSLIHIQ